MTGLHSRIIEIEARAAELQLIACRAVVPEVRVRNSRRAEVLREEAAQLKSRHARPQADGLEGVSHA